MKTNYNQFETIDQLARTALTDYEMPFEAMDWDKMDAELDKQYAQPAAKLWLVKGAEVLLMAATLTTMLYYTNNNAMLKYAENNANNLANTNTIIAPQNSDMASQNEILTTKTANNNAENIVIENNTQNNNENTSEKNGENNATKLFAKTTKFAGSKNTLNQAVLSPNQPLSQLVSNTNINTNSNSVINTNNIIGNNSNNITENSDNAANKNAAQNLIIQAAPAIIRDANGNVIPNKENANINTNNNTRNIESLETLPTLQPSLLENNLNITVQIEPLYIAQNDDKPYDFTKRKPKAFGFGIVSAGDFNSVIQNSYDGIKLTEGFGTTLGAKVFCRIAKRFGLETGILGSFKNYKAAKDYATASPPSEVVQKTSINIIQIPLNIVIDAFESPEWRVYAKTGITYNTIANGSYTWRNGAQTEFNLLENPVKVIDNSNIIRENNRDLTSPQVNSSLSLNMSMGVSRRINRHISILCEPTYQHALKGIGTHSDMINTVSLTFGATYTL